MMVVLQSKESIGRHACKPGIREASMDGDMQSKKQKRKGKQWV